VFKGSTVVLKQRPGADKYPYLVTRRKQLIDDESLIEKSGSLVFTRDVEFSSPSAAASVVCGGSANGLVSWQSQEGTRREQYFRDPERSEMLPVLFSAHEKAANDPRQSVNIPASDVCCPARSHRRTFTVT
jgi:hypothetical protein